MIARLPVSRYASSALAQISAFYQEELNNLVRLVVDDAPLEEIQRSREALVELSKQWNALHWDTHSSTGRPSNAHKYIFMRGDVQYECTCSATASDDCAWTIRRSGCEVDGPKCDGNEFSSAERTMEFEQFAVAAVAACTKACALT